MITLKIDKVEKGSAEAFEIDSRGISGWQLLVDIPKDSAARSREIAIGMKITGYIIPGYAGDAGDKTVKLAQWARVGSDKSDAYRKVTLQNISAGVVEREFIFPQAYVASYKEHFAADSGDGTFEMIIRQRRTAAWTDDGKVKFNSKGFKYEEKKS